MRSFCCLFELPLVAGWYRQSLSSNRSIRRSSCAFDQMYFFGAILPLCKNPVLASPNARKWVYSSWWWLPIPTCWYRGPDAKVTRRRSHPTPKSPDAKLLADPMRVIYLYSKGFFYTLGANFLALGETRVR